MLRALAGAINSLRMVQPLHDQQVEGILGALDDADEVMRAAHDASDDVRRYLLGLVHEARRVTADWRTFGAEPVRSKNLERRGALYTMAEQAAEPEGQGAWRGAARAVTLQVLGGGVFPVDSPLIRALTCNDWTRDNGLMARRAAPPAMPSTNRPASTSPSPTTASAADPTSDHARVGVAALPFGCVGRVVSDIRTVRASRAVPPAADYANGA